MSFICARPLRYLWENTHPNLLNLYCSNETPMSPADLADLRRQNPKTAKQQQQQQPQTTCLSQRDQREILGFRLCI